MKKILLLVLVVFAGVWLFLSSSTTVTKNVDNYIYRLPFKTGTAYKVVQGYGGRFSHAHKAALDFDLPEGTPVYAARGGQIYSTKDDSNTGGIFSKNEEANYIIIKHEDGSFGCYWHLMQKGVVKKKGTIKKGELIGYSGHTGFSLSPHLHFAVKKRLSYHKDAFMKARFKTSEGVVFLKKGKSYTASY
jgi:murein DD-endopeptidase MepM/ murein hydrolase activator NlpD